MKQNQQRPGVMMYFHLLEPMRALSREQFAEMIWALMDYAQYGVLPEFADPLMAMSWGYLRHAADVDLQRYEMRKQRASKAAGMRWHPEAMHNDAYDAIYKHNTETEPQADADADTQASANTDPQTATEAEPDPYSETPTEAAWAPSAAEMEPLATPLAMANSPSWAKMVEASRHRMGSEAFAQWREEQIEAITKQNEALRAEARARNQQMTS